MPFTDSRLGPGTFLVGTAPGTEYGFQVSALTLTPAVSSEDGTPTLADPEPPPLTTTDYSLDGTAILDFTDPQGLSRFAYDNDGATMDFVWTPSTPDGTQLTGQCVVRAFPIGGEVSVQLTQDFSWPTVGKPVFSGDLPLAAGAESSGKRSKS